MECKFGMAESWVCVWGALYKGVMVYSFFEVVVSRI